MSFTHLSHSVCVLSKTSSINSWRLQLTDSRRLNCLVGSCLLLLLICDWRGFNHFRTSRNAAEGYRADISTDGSHWLVWWWAIISLYHHKTRVVVITICHNDKNISTISNFIWVTTACSFSIRWFALVMEWTEWSKIITITGNHRQTTGKRYRALHVGGDEHHWLVTYQVHNHMFQAVMRVLRRGLAEYSTILLGDQDHPCCTLPCLQSKPTRWPSTLIGQSYRWFWFTVYWKW